MSTACIGHRAVREPVDYRQFNFNLNIMDVHSFSYVFQFFLQKWGIINAKRCVFGIYTLFGKSNFLDIVQ